MPIPSPGQTFLSVRLGMDDLSLLIDAVEGTADHDTTGSEIDHRRRLLNRLVDKACLLHDHCFEL